METQDGSPLWSAAGGHSTDWSGPGPMELLCGGALAWLLHHALLHKIPTPNWHIRRSAVLQNFSLVFKKLCKSINRIRAVEYSAVVQAAILNVKGNHVNGGTSPISRITGHGLVVVVRGTSSLRDPDLDPDLDRHLHLVVGSTSCRVGPTTSGLQAEVVTWYACNLMCCMASRAPRQAAACCALKSLVSIPVYVMSTMAYLIFILVALFSSVLFLVLILRCIRSSLWLSGPQFYSDSYFFGDGSTILLPLGLLVRASCTSDNIINCILQLSDYIFFNGFTGPLLTVAVRGQSPWVHASQTPLRIPLASGTVNLHAQVDAAVFISGLWTLMYQDPLCGISLYYDCFSI